MDVDQSEREGRFVVKPGVDVELDESECVSVCVKGLSVGEWVAGYDEGLDVGG